MGALEDLKRPEFRRAIVQGHPGGEGLRVSGDCGVVPMGGGTEAIGAGEDEARDGLGMDEEVRADQEFHHRAQGGMVRESMEGFEFEDPVADAPEGGVGIAEGDAGTCYSVQGKAGGIEPSRGGDDLRDLGEQEIEILREQQVADEHVTVGGEVLAAGCVRLIRSREFRETA